MYYTNDKPVLPNTSKCPVDGFDFALYQKCHYKLHIYYKISKEPIPEHLKKRIKYTEIMKKFIFIFFFCVQTLFVFCM